MPEQIIQQNIDIPMCVDVTVSSSSVNAASSSSHIDSTASSHNNLSSMPMSPAAASTHSAYMSNAGVANLSLAPSSGISDFYDNDRLRFHTRCGSLVKLSPNCRTGERRRPLDEFNNGVVMTHRPLKDNELFEIRIDKLVDKWSGSIEVGVTTHNPAVLHFPATMTNMRSGTIMVN